MCICNSCTLNNCNEKGNSKGGRAIRIRKMYLERIPVSIQIYRLFFLRRPLEYFLFAHQVKIYDFDPRHNRPSRTQIKCFQDSRTSGIPGSRYHLCYFKLKLVFFILFLNTAFNSEYNSLKLSVITCYSFWYVKFSRKF